MDESHQESLSQVKLIKEEEIATSKSKSKTSKKSNFKQFINCLSCFCNIFTSLFNKINSCLSKCSVIIQFSIFLIPISVIMIILMYIIHVNFYSDLYVFNFSKTLKEEFLDLFITQIDDFKTELTAIVVKETNLDVENQLFFQIYFQELTSCGFLETNTEGKKIIQNFGDNENSTFLFSSLNRYKGIDVNFTLDADITKEKIDEINYYNLGEFAKLYYYMLPSIWYESTMMNSIINQSFFIAYEFEKDTKKLIDNYLFFRYPKNSDGFKINNNFIQSNYLLNPLCSNKSYDHTNAYKDYRIYFDKENWFINLDYHYRELVNTSEDLFTKISLAHLNVENDGNINKTFITFSQQYIKYNDRHYMINIIFFLNQINLKEGDNDYTSFLIKKNISLDDMQFLTEKYADNSTYVLSISDSTEYSMAEMDYRFFHLGLYDNKFNFYMNGIFYDSFDLKYFYEYSDFFSTAKEGEYDLKFFVTLYLYKSLFQNVRYAKVVKDRDEIFLYHFRNEKVKNICSKINFNSYREYLRNTGIDCWDKRNQVYFDPKNFIHITMDNDSKTIDPIYPYCSCLPLYCLKNYEELDEDLEDFEISDKINLPNKCQNKFTSYETHLSNSHYTGNNKILRLIDSSVTSINYDYVKFIVLDLNQIHGYFFLMISQIETTGESYIHSYYKLVTKIEITILVLFLTIVISILSIIIIYISLKKYSLIIEKFKQKYELFVFHSEYEIESNSNKNEELNKYMRDKENKKLEEKLIINENFQSLENDNLLSKDFFNINENALLDDLFSIFSEAYNINRNDIEKFYSKQSHKSKNEMKVDMMKQKNELFELLATFCLHSTFFQLNLNFDYNMYEYTEIIKKYNHYVGQLETIDKEQTRLTQNILYELISTECIADYGLITNFNFKYISNIKADSKKNSIQYTMFENIKNKQRKRSEISGDDDEINEFQEKKLILKRKNVLIDIFKNRFESDDFLNYNKLDSAFNFFLINSYYKYSRQIALENVVS